MSGITCYECGEFIDPFGNGPYAGYRCLYCKRWFCRFHAIENFAQEFARAGKVPPLLPDRDLSP